MTKHLAHPSVMLPGTARHTVASAALADTLRIEVSVPVDYEESSHDYPVVYLIDGYWFFPIVSQAAWLLALDGELPSVVVVGIGYEPAGLSRAQEDERVTHLRCRDLTPTLDTTEWWRLAAGGKRLGIGVETGHAEDFIHVIENEIKPLVRSHYRVRDDDETLAGFSFGGLFALHVLFKHTESFDRYVVGSPSLWWDGGVMFDFEEQYAASHTDLPKSLFLAVGAAEASGIGAACKMVDNLESLTRRMAGRRYASLKWESAILQGENHSTGIAPTFLRGLISVFRR